MEIVRSLQELREKLDPIRRAGHSIGLVPTMGALHDGHVSLLKRAREQAAVTVVSIFVNPLQFGPKEDFFHYPRETEKDKELLIKSGATLLYVPDEKDMYAKDFGARIHLGTLSEEMEGRIRPHFFEGVATVVLKLLMRVQPDIVMFGEKDYQQLVLIRKMVRELDIPVEVLASPTVREKDGLALSSRNRYLSPEERKIAPALYFTLNEIKKQLIDIRHVEEVTHTAEKTLKTMGFSSVDYVEVRDADTLGVATVLLKPTRVLAAARLGNTRIIDNILL